MSHTNGKVPAVSVLMPVYNTARYLAQALESILAQTFGDFEFVILDDGSTDGSVNIVQEYAQRDPRIRFFPLAHQGYVSVLRQGLSHCRGEFVARMDSDDVAKPDRLEKQLHFLRAHPEIVAVGSQIEIIDPYGSPIDRPQHKLKHEEIEADMLVGIGWAMVHPTVVMRRAVVMEIGGYRQDLTVSEDLDLFLRLAECGRVANLPEVLLQYRQHLTSVNYNCYEQQKAAKRQIIADAYKRRGIEMPPDWKMRERKVLPQGEQYRRWGWAAIRGGNVAVARKHAWSALRKTPLSIDSWRLTACAIRGR